MIVVAIVLRVLAFMLGIGVVVAALISAMRVFVLPRGARDRVSTFVFATVQRLFDPWLGRQRSYEARDRILAFLAPVGLIILPVVWLTLVLLGYAAIFAALGITPWTALTISGSSLLTLGFAADTHPAPVLLTFSEATIGLVLVALLISFLPTMYAAFARREAAVTALETRAGSPPSPAAMLVRLHRIGRLDHISEVWGPWEDWFVDIGESHTTLAPLIFYRSAQPTGSWVTAAGCILDAAALVSSTLEGPRDPRAELCIRAGYLALQRIATLVALPFDPDPHYPETPIGVAREEWEALCEFLAAKGIALKPDRDKAWRDFAGWRVNYDAVLIALSGLTMAPPAAWSSDRRLPPEERRTLALGMGRRQIVQG